MGFSDDGVSSRFRVEEEGLGRAPAPLRRQFPSPREDRREATGRSFVARAWRREAVSDTSGMDDPSGGRAETLEAACWVEVRISVRDERDVSRMGRRASEICGRSEPVRASKRYDSGVIMSMIS